MLNLKKGALLATNKELPYREEKSGKKAHFPTGTRVLVVKGGATPHIRFLYVEANGDIRTSSVKKEYLEAHFVQAEPTPEPLLAGWTVKGAEEIEGHETRNFNLKLFYKGQLAAHVSNDGWGGETMAHFVDAEAKKVFDQAVKALAEQYIQDNNVTDKREQELEHNVTWGEVFHYFLDGYHLGAMTYGQYYKMTTDSYDNYTKSNFKQVGES